MKGETLEKPQPLVKSPEKRRTDVFSQQKCLEERVAHKFTLRYDTFQESEEPSTGSEKSGSSMSERLNRCVRSKCSGIDIQSNLSNFEDESCASSITSSDHSHPYEEIPRVNCNDRHSCHSLPSYRVYAETDVSSFRENFPPPPSPSELYKNVVSTENLPEKYKAKEETTAKNLVESSRSRSFTGTSDRYGSSERFSAGLTKNCPKICEKEFSLEESERPNGISDSEKHQLEMFFKSLKTDVFVCGSLANLYFGWKEGEGNWTYSHTGIVVVVFDSGNTRCRNKRKIQILLAERGTCFPLWKDTIDNLSAYRKSGSAFHTMYLSCDHRQLVGLSFDFPSEADKLLNHLEGLTSNPENINISAPASRKKKKASEKKATPLPHKEQISNPCLFQHVTSVAAKDKPIYISLQTLIDSENIKKTENIC